MEKMDKAAGIYAPGWKNTTPEQQREAQGRIADLLNRLSEDFTATLTQIQRVADEFGIEVYIAPTGYGSGQTYHPKGDKEFEASGTGGSEYDPIAGEWYSSSNC